MDSTHIHLFLNHAPVAGVAFGLFFLTMGFLRRSETMRLSAITLFTLSSLLVLPVFFTGEAAEETAEGLPGVSESVIESHEDAAKVAIWGMVLLGVASIGTLTYAAKKRALPMPLVGLVAVLAVTSMGLIGRTAYLGGQIRHTELHGAAQGGQGSQEGSQDGGENEGERSGDD
ncbi:MAG TPA: hypothetical protein VFH43_03225 [Candidatus Kapabacteria bacterium]|nr:hypothetical protein [Candidatus Kapabacteria bacterium]